ncbi:hypothetical protein [Methylobacterium sp. sgz302541]|uniref:hypothetical protein n=1 Tax=unclassified Methylobacterium TaxID=2615210 RepID=UPI003D3348BE
MRKVLGSGTGQARSLAETAYLPRSAHTGSTWIALGAPLGATLILVVARLLGV